MKSSNQKSWATFLIALGVFLIAISPLSQVKYLNIISGVAMMALGFVRLKK